MPSCAQPPGPPGAGTNRTRARAGRCGPQGSAACGRASDRSGPAAACLGGPLRGPGGLSGNPDHRPLRGWGLCFPPAGLCHATSPWAPRGGLRRFCGAGRYGPQGSAACGRASDRSGWAAACLGGPLRGPGGLSGNPDHRPLRGWGLCFPPAGLCHATSPWAPRGGFF